MGNLQGFCELRVTVYSFKVRGPFEAQGTTNPTGRSLGAGQHPCMVRLCRLPCKSKLSSWHHEQAVLHSATSEICVRLQVRERLSLLVPTGRSDWGKLLLGVSTPSCTSAHGAVDRGHSVQEALLPSIRSSKMGPFGQDTAQTAHDQLVTVPCTRPAGQQISHNRAVHTSKAHWRGPSLRWGLWQQMQTG